MNKTRKPKLQFNEMLRITVRMKQLILHKSWSMNSTRWINETVRCLLQKNLRFSFYFAQELRFSSPAPVSTFWSVGPSNMLNVNANMELKRGSKHNLDLD